MNRTVLPLVLAAAFGLPAVMTVVGQQDAAEIKAVKQDVQQRNVKGRLPAYFGQIVDAGQRQRIYQIQANYSQQIEALEAQIEVLTTKRDAEILAVLSPEQRKRFATMVNGAKAARAAKAAQKKTANEKQK